MDGTIGRSCNCDRYLSSNVELNPDLHLKGQKAKSFDEVLQVHNSDLLGDWWSVGFISCMIRTPQWGLRESGMRGVEALLGSYHSTKHNKLFIIGRLLRR